MLHVNWLQSQTLSMVSFFSSKESRASKNKLESRPPPFTEAKREAFKSTNIMLSLLQRGVQTMMRKGDAESSDAE